MTDLLTYHNDNARTGQTLHEEVLSPGNVTTNHFGLLWTLPADGKVDAEPLYAAGVPIPGQGQHNLLLVVTEHDTVYAFDADSTNKLWQVSMLGTNETPSDPIAPCTLLVPEIGVTATPVIDRQLGSNGTIFVVAMSKNGSTYYHRIHALDLATGHDLVPPTTVAATFPGTGANSSGGNVIFDPKQYMDRSGLLLLNGVVYTAWASHCDQDPYTGWVIGYDEHTLAQTNVINVTPNGMEGGIWMAGAGLAADASNNIYFLDGNGTFDTALTAGGFPASGDFGNAFIKLSTTGTALAVADYFTMSNTVNESLLDLDLGSGGALLLPDMIDTNGNTRQLAVGAGKDQIIYLVDRNNMGKFSPTTNLNYQSVNGAINGVFSMPAYFNGTLYYGSTNDHLRAFPFQNALLGAASSHTSATFVYPGTTPGVSANGASNGIVWASENTAPIVLHAYSAANLTVELYNSNQAGSRDHFGVGNKFITPAIASARVYVAGTNSVGVFGLLDTSTLSPLQQWRNTYFHNPSNVGAGANTAAPMGDGVPNLLKYALGLNPTTFVSTAQLPAPGIQPDSGQDYLSLIVNRAADPTDVTYNVEVSGDLRTWQFGPPFTVTLTNTPSLLGVRDNTPVTAAPARFIRLQVTNP